MTADNGVPLNFRDSPEVVRRIEDLVMRGVFPSRSEFFRLASKELLEQHSDTSNAKKATINIPNKLHEWIMLNVIGSGYELNMEALLNRLLKEYIEKQIEIEQRTEEIAQEITLRRTELERLERENRRKLLR